MRVVAGTVGGLQLQVPKHDVRPTMDRVKAAIFSSLGERVVGARVLDLFAGSGALGIEALSRGCASVTFVEKNDQAARTIKRNLDWTKLAGDVREMDVFSFLDRVSTPEGYDLIFADPPYAKAPGERDFGQELLHCDALRKCLAPGGCFVLEQLPGTGSHEKSGWDCVRLKKYGATEVAFLQLPQITQILGEE